MKLISWNVNGIRACSRTHFPKWFEKEAADVVCLQEIKAHPEQVAEELRHPAGYHSFWHPAEKPGYSGTAIFTRKEPLSVQLGIGVPEIDREGRILQAEFKDFTLLNCYFPNSQREHTRLPFKLDFCARLLKHTQKLRSKGKNVVICGDFNIAHKEIDLKNPKSNAKNAGFLPEERAWMDRFIEAKYVDVFREFEKGPGHYTWWSYRPGVREKNVGWRLDYFCANSEFRDRLKGMKHQCDVMGSDHCPVVLELKK
jgi:exodeoxyribonuclease III